MAKEISEAVSSISKAQCAMLLSELRRLYDIRKQGSLTGAEQTRYQSAMALCKKEAVDAAKAFVKERANTEDLCNLSKDDAEFCIYLMNKIIPHEGMRRELSVCYYRLGDFRRAEKLTIGRGLHLGWHGEVYKNESMPNIFGGPFPYSDEIMGWRSLAKTVEKIIDFDIGAACRMSGVVEEYIAYAKQQKEIYRLSELEESLEKMWAEVSEM